MQKYKSMGEVVIECLIKWFLILLFAGGFLIAYMNYFGHY